MPLILNNNSISKCWQNSIAGIPYGLKVEIRCCAEKRSLKELILIRDVFQLRSSLELPLKVVEGVDLD